MFAEHIVSDGTRLRRRPSSARQTGSTYRTGLCALLSVAVWLTTNCVCIAGFEQTENGQASSQHANPWYARTEQLEEIALEADRHARSGFELAGRKALYAARAEFIAALRLIAQGLDAQERTDRHSRALRDALTALRECDDFIPRGGRVEADLDLALLVEAHTTSLLKNTNLREITPLDALRRYLEYAQASLAEAGRRETSAAMALYGLGKLHTVWARSTVAEIPGCEAKAVVFLQAAILVEPENSFAANELGVLLARSQRWSNAIDWFRYAAQVQPDATIWRNLAVAYHHLGQPAAANQVLQQAERWLASNRFGQVAPETDYDVHWLDPRTFSATDRTVVASAATEPRQSLLRSSNRTFPTVPPSSNPFETRGRSPSADFSLVNGRSDPSPTLLEARKPPTLLVPTNGFTPPKPTVLPPQRPVVPRTESPPIPNYVPASPVPSRRAVGYWPSPAPSSAITWAAFPLDDERTSENGEEARYQRRDRMIRQVRSIPPEKYTEIMLCQALGPAAPCDIRAVDCSCCNGHCRGWCRQQIRRAQWQAYAQGEYVGHARSEHVPEYRLRVDDQLDMIYRVTRDETSQPYKLNVGDEISVESFTDPELNRNLIIQPDGSITLRLLGQIKATGRTVSQLRDLLEEKYKQYYKAPAITVTPLKVNTKLEDLRATVDRRAGIGGQSQLVRITPEGTISLPAIGSVYAQGLTLRELQTELNERYRQQVEGIEVVPVLAQRAPRYVYVLGEVRTPGRFELTGPTTAIQAIAMAGSWNVGAHLRQVVVFRRGDDWRLLATIIDLEKALCGNQPCPAGEIWLADSDVIIVPKSPILKAADFIDLVFTRGIYGVFPLQANINFIKASSI